jgi:hypothetical protein
MIGFKFARFHFLKFGLTMVGNGVPEVKIRCPRGAGSAGSTPTRRRRRRMTNPKDSNLMGLIMTRVG